MTRLLNKVLSFLFSDEMETEITIESEISVEECIYIHFLLGNLNQDVLINKKYHQMFNFLHGTIEFARIFDRQEAQDLLEDIRNGISLFVGKQGVEGHSFDAVLWNLIRACWYNGYNTLELIFITTTFPNKFLANELVSRTFQYSKAEFRMKLITEWNFLIIN